MRGDWEKDPYVKKWFSSNISERSVSNYKRIFPSWQDFIQMTPTEQIEKRIKDIQTSDPRIRGFFEDKVIEYKQVLEAREYSSSTIHSYISCDQSFFSKKRLKLSFSRGDLAVRSRKKVVKKWTPNNEEIRAVYHFLDSARDRAILLLMYHSGLNEADIRQLNVQDFSDLVEDEHYFFEKRRQKTDMLTRTCLSSEAVHELRVYLRQRGNPEKGALFVTHKGNRIDNRTINNAMKQAVEKAQPKRANEWKTKNLRSSYNDALLRAGLTQEIKDLMLGHKRQGARGSYECSPTTIKEAYQRSFKYLSINGGAQARKDLARIENMVVGQSDVIAKQAETIEHLKDELRDLQNTFEVFLMSKLGEGHEDLKKKLRKNQQERMKPHKDWREDEY